MIDRTTTETEGDAGGGDGAAPIAAGDEVSWTAFGDVHFTGRVLDVDGAGHAFVLIHGEARRTLLECASLTRVPGSENWRTPARSDEGGQGGQGDASIHTL